MKEIALRTLHRRGKNRTMKKEDLSFGGGYAFLVPATESIHV